MRWLRTHIKLGSRLALFALALQLGLTFGHVHGISAGAAETAFSALTHHKVTQTSDERGQKSGDPSDLDCPICALIQLASTSAASVPPALPIPAKYIVLKLQTLELPEWAASPYFTFQARGPPSL